MYLLVNHNVYSSSELLAYFFKATSFGKVVGEQTGGDGIGTDPIILALPNSGIIIRFTGEMGLNPNGSANEEKKTVPDIWLETTSRSEARRLLLERISSLD
ncbi:MAG: S41 family peptidase [Bacteroidota bacterium]